MNRPLDRRSSARSTSSIVPFLAMWLASVFAPPMLAEPALVEVSIDTQPALSGTVFLGGQPLYSSPAGSVVQLVITAEFDDGTSTDVTQDAATQYTVAGPHASVTAAGLLTLGAPPGIVMTAVQVDHGPITKLVAFEISPQ